jgi:hypothetical protein
LINSNRFSPAIFSPLLDEQLIAGWLIFNMPAISTVLMPGLKYAQ